MANAPEQGLDRVTLLRVADEALYQAKSAGRNRVGGIVVATGQPFTPAGGEGAAARGARKPKAIAAGA